MAWRMRPPSSPGISARECPRAGRPRHGPVEILGLRVQREEVGEGRVRRGAKVGCGRFAQPPRLSDPRAGGFGGFLGGHGGPPPRWETKAPLCAGIGNTIRPFVTG